MTQTLVGTPDPEDRDAYQNAVHKHLGGFRKRASTGDESQDRLLSEMKKNRQVSRKTAASAGATSTGGGPSSLSFATGRPRDPLFYWRQNNLPYDVTKEDELRKIREYCNTPDAPIWMGDYSFKKLGDIVVGDVVLGWGYNTGPSGAQRKKMTRTEVLAVNRRVAPEVVRVTFESGRVIRCTPDHQWANPHYSPTGKPNRFGWSQPEYRPAEVGRSMVRVIDPTEALTDEKQRLVAAWLGGVYDGEGCGVSIAQSAAYNPAVCERIKDSLDLLGLPWTQDANNVHIRRQGGRTGSVQNLTNFLNWTQATRRTSNAIDKVMLACPNGGTDKVVSIESEGPGEVISMQTTTGNYVAWGFASRNCRLLYLTHPIIASCVDIFTKYPLLGMELVCKDEQLKEFYENLFFDQLHYKEFLIDVGREYWTVGESWAFGSFNEMLGVWEDDELLNPDDCEVVRSPFMKDPRFLIRLPETIRKVINDQSPKWEYEKLMMNYPELKEYAGPDALMPVSNILLKQLKFKGDTFHKRGLPILMRAFRAIMQEEMFMAAMDSIADRLYTPLILVKLGASATDLGTSVPWIPTEDDLADFEEALDGALAGDFRVLIHHFAIEMAPVFGRENMPNMDNDFDRIQERILQTFGLSKTMLSGADGGETYAADALNRDLISQLLETYQHLIIELYNERAKVVAEAQQHYDYELRGGKRYPIMEEVLEIDEETGEYRVVEQPKLLWPELRMKTMQMADEESERQFLEALRSSGVPISMKTRMTNLPVDLDEEIERAQEEQVQLAVAEQETRKRTYLALRAEGLPIPDDLRADFQPKASNAQEETEGAGIPGMDEGVRVPLLGVDPTTGTPTLAPTPDDLLDTPADDSSTAAPMPPNPLDPLGLSNLIPLPRNQALGPEESDEQRKNMPKPASLADRMLDPRHIGMRRKLDRTKPLDEQADSA